MSRHSISTDEDVHRPYRQVFADASARTGDSDTYTSEDLYKKAFQLDTAQEYFLSTTDPTWTLVSGSGGGVTLPAGTRPLELLIADEGITNFATSSLTVTQTATTVTVTPTGSATIMTLSCSTDLNIEAGDDIIVTAFDTIIVDSESTEITSNDYQRFDAGNNFRFRLQSSPSTPVGSGSISFLDQKQGGVDTAGLNARDVFFYVSGSPGTKNSATTAGVALFGGDVQISGAAHFGEESPTVSSSLIIESVGSAPGFAGSNAGVALRSHIAGATILVSGANFLAIGETTAVMIAEQVSLASPQNIRFLLSSDTGLPGWTQPAENFRHFYFADNIINNDDVPTTGEAHDVMFFVSGVIGGKDTASGSVALFGGDVVVSGNLTVGSIAGRADTVSDAVIQTTTSSLTSIVSYTTATNNRAIDMKVRVFASSSTDGEMAKYVIESLFVRGGAGLVEEKDTNYVSIFEDNSAWDVQLGITSSVIHVMVQSSGAQTVEWRAQFEVNEL